MSQMKELKERIARLIHTEWKAVWKPYEVASDEERAYARELADKILDVFFNWLGSLREDVPIEELEKRLAEKELTEGESLQNKQKIVLLLMDAFNYILCGERSRAARIIADILHFLAGGKEDISTPEALRKAPIKE